MFPTWLTTLLDRSRVQNASEKPQALLTGDVNGDFSGIVRQLMGAMEQVQQIRPHIGTMLTNLQSIPQLQRDVRAFGNPTQDVGGEQQIGFGIGAPLRRAYGGGRL